MFRGICALLTDPRTGLAKDCMHLLDSTTDFALKRHPFNEVTLMLLTDRVSDALNIVLICIEEIYMRCNNGLNAGNVELACPKMYSKLQFRSIL